MTKSVTGVAMGKTLCNILGLDAKKVISLELYVRADSIVTVTVGQVVWQEEMQKLVEELKNYELVETDDTPHITGNDELNTFEPDDSTN